MDELHRLLQRQLKKYLPGFVPNDLKLEALVRAVNQSYIHFENDRALVERAMKLSSDEIWESKQHILADSLRQTILIDSLKNTIHQISPEVHIHDDTDLLKIADVLGAEILKRKLAEEELKEANKALESLMNARQSFLLSISHEIRTPLHAITGMTNLLNQTPTSETQKEYLKIVQSSADGLLVILNDLLDMGKIESGKFSLEEVDFKLDDIFDTLYKSMSIRAAEKGIELLVEKDPGLREYLLGDPTRLNQVLTNLLANAIKFTLAGRVHLQVSKIKESENEEVLLFRVADTGIGIEPSRLEVIFEQFAQEDKSVARKFGGTGLGLSISQSLVEMMGGKISVESIKGQGSIFQFCIPLKKGQQVSQTEEFKMDATALHGLRVLLADDNEINRYLIHAIFKNWGINVVSAADGRECIDILRKGTFDMIFMDLQMPELDGFEATKLIRSEIDPNIPIIAITANALNSEVEKCRKLGMDDYIVKPFKSSELYNVMLKHSNKPLSDFNSSSNGILSRFSLDRLKNLYNNNLDQVRGTTFIFIEQMDIELEKLMQSRGKPEKEKVEAIIHKMKPNLELFGMDLLLAEALKMLSVFEMKKRSLWGISIVEFVDVAANELLIAKQIYQKTFTEFG